MPNLSNEDITQAGYANDFIFGLAPAALQFSLLAQGLQAPRGQISYLQLGCGFGLTAQIIAAANPDVSVLGVDPGEAQIARARELAEAAGTPNVAFHATSYAELAANANLPTFDIIAVHGVYSWVSAADRGFIQDIVRRCLKPGGLVYITYNALPGWADAAPLQRLIRDASQLGSGDVAQRLSQGIAFASRLKELGSRYFAGNEGAVKRLATFGKASVPNLVREYLTQGWAAFHFADVANVFGEAGLAFACQGNPGLQLDLINFTAEQRQLLDGIGDATFRETTRDFLLNTQFRRDIYVREVAALPREEQQSIWLDRRFLLARPAADVPRVARAPVGDITLQPAVYDPILAVLDRGPCTMRELIADPAVAGLSFERVAEALFFLVAMEMVSHALPVEGMELRAQRTAELNAAILARVEAGEEIVVLASPATGSAVTLDRLTLLFLLAHQRNDADPVDFVRRTLEAQGQKIVKNGVELQDQQLIHEELSAAYTVFKTANLPRLEQLGIR